MREKCLSRLVLGILFLACVLPSGVVAQTTSADTDKKISELEKQLEAIRAELDALKAKTVETSTPASTVPPAQASAVVPTASAAPAPSPMAGITSVLGGVNLTGLADVYYGYNANHPVNGPNAATDGTATQPFQRYTNQFGLNLIELQLDKVPDKTSPLGFRVALGFGQAMNAVNGSDPGGLAFAQYLKEGYLSYFGPLGKGLQIDVGKFVTPAGAEVIETNQNWNYSRSILFYYAIPYYHFGVRAKYTFNDKLSVTGYAVNGWNDIVGVNNGKTAGVSVAWNATKKITLTENYLGGIRGDLGTATSGPTNHLSDTVLAYNPTTKLSFMGNFDYNRREAFQLVKTPTDYSGIAAYVKYAFTPNAAFAGRFEYFNDHDGLASGTAQHWNEFTGTFERRIAGHLLSRLEYRHDSSNQNFFERGSTAFVKGQTTVNAGLIFVLEPNDTK